MLLSSDEENSLEVKHSRHEEINFNQNYKELLAGVNRIRYLKKKQMHNHQMMTQHFNNLLNKIEKHTSPKAQKSKPNFELPKTLSQQTNKFSRFRYVFAEESPYKPKNGKQPTIARKQTCRFSKSGNLLKISTENQKENYSHLFEDKPTDVTLINFSSSRVEQTADKRQKFRELIRKKQENYQYMRQLRLKMEDKSYRQRQQHLTAVRESKLRVDISRQEGKKRIEEQYFRHLEAIKAQKEADRDKKARINKQKYLEMLKVQKQEQEELDLYERSLILEEELKQFIQHSSGSNLLPCEAKEPQDTTLI